MRWDELGHSVASGQEMVVSTLHNFTSHFQFGSMFLVLINRINKIHLMQFGDVRGGREPDGRCNGRQDLPTSRSAGNGFGSGRVWWISQAIQSVGVMFVST